MSFFRERSIQLLPLWQLPLVIITAIEAPLPPVSASPCLAEEPAADIVLNVTTHSRGHRPFPAPASTSASQRVGRSSPKSYLASSGYTPPYVSAGGP